MDNDFRYKFIPPDSSLAQFVERIGMFQNSSYESKEVVIIPDGRIDLFFSRTKNSNFQVWLMGLETAPKQRSIQPGTLTFSISFKPLGVDYLLPVSIAAFLNSAQQMPDDFWGFSANDLNDFDAFYQKANQKMRQLLPAAIDERKVKLFELMYASNGETTVKELSEKAFWSSRQINRYFNQHLGLSLKMFCKILRFRASLEHVAHGQLYPELNFTDQTHFIKNIKQFSGVVPKELSKNKNDRFVLLSVLKDK
ncbi:MAG: AraC family transcriptional regulator [Pedobacter sp.]|nr:MAG: AraC family transcriptional regulator [Pedobacter sp.]